MSLDSLKNRLKEKAVGPIASALMEKMDELIKQQKEANRLLREIKEALAK